VVTCEERSNVIAVLARANRFRMMFARDAQPQIPVTGPTDSCSFHQRGTSLGNSKPLRLQGLPSAGCQLGLGGLLVAHRGFEPLRDKMALPRGFFSVLGFRGHKMVTELTELLAQIANVQVQSRLSRYA
jgi:hypothetical protein